MILIMIPRLSREANALPTVLSDIPVPTAISRVVTSLGGR